MHKLIVGLEIHVQLKTNTKLFCSCSTTPSETNQNTCPTCLGLPGATLSLNRKAIDLAIKTGIILNSTIAPITKWDRKQYFYPDSPKGYQISQYYNPICTNGYFEVPQTNKKINIHQAHLEEDAGKITNNSEIDLNRAGIPLLEIVTKPDFNSAKETKDWLQELRLNLIHQEISDCQMEKGQLRCDVNINLEIDGIKTPITEIKNLNSFKFIEQAISAEEIRQLKLYKEKQYKIGDIPKETRGFDEKTGTTKLQRSKEEAADYRYFPEPDLCYIKTSIPVNIKTLNDSRKEWGIPYSDSSFIVENGLSEIYSKAILNHNPKEIANWYINEPLFKKVPVNLIDKIVKFPKSVAKQILEKWNKENFSIESYDKITLEFSQSNDLKSIVIKIINENPKAKQDYLNGKQEAASSLIGKVLKESKGENPQIVKNLILEQFQCTT